jgi:anti-sigma-K factor RskA
MNTQFEEHACLYVLDQLDAQDRAAFEARLSRDPQLAALVRDLEATLERRVRSLPRHEPDEGLLRRIDSRIDRLPSVDIGRRSAASLWAATARWGIAAVIALSAGTLAVQSLRRPAPGAPAVILVGLESLRSTLSELPIQGQPGNEDARFIQLASLAEKYWRRPPGAASAGAPAARSAKAGAAAAANEGYALFDPASSQGFIAIRHMQEAAAGKTYHLWVVDTATGAFREAGVLPSARPGGGLYFFSVAPLGETKPGGLSVFVTAEDAGSAELAAPRGNVVLGDRRI